MKLAIFLFAFVAIIHGAPSDGLFGAAKDAGRAVLNNLGNNVKAAATNVGGCSSGIKL